MDRQLLPQKVGQKISVIKTNAFVIFKAVLSVRKKFDCKVTRWKLWFKSANVIIFCQTKVSLW